MRRVSFITVFKFQEGQGLRVGGLQNSRQTNKPLMKKERRVNLGAGKCKPEYCWGELEDNERHLKVRIFQVLEESGLLGLTGFSRDLEKVGINLAEDAGLPSCLGLQ